MAGASARKVWESFVDFNSCHRMVSLRKLYFVTLIYSLKVNNLKKIYISETVRVSAKNSQNNFNGFGYLPSYE